MTDRAVGDDVHLGPLGHIAPFLRIAALVMTIVGGVPAANADGLGMPSIRLTQSTEVVCQAPITKTQYVVRVVKEKSRCFREVMAPDRGSIDRRDEVSCETTCSPRPPQG